MIRKLSELTLAAALMTALAVLVTWPQAAHLRTHIIPHHDTLFSIWRLGWIAHALVTAPWHLFDANIFYPATNTLTYSDAMLLQGIVAAPFFWLGVSPVLIYNVLLLIGFAGSGLGMYVLARHVTGAVGPALVAAATFTVAPYRIEHVIHLELLWTMWIPLTLWALHCAVEQSSWRWGAVAGVFFWLQVISCVYYGVFLALLLIVFTPILLVISGRRALPALVPVGATVVVSALLTLPYAWPYIRTAGELGGRDQRDILRYSAHAYNYLSSTSFSRVWGWTADRWGGSELRLFPGLMTIVLALVGVLNRNRWTWLLYAIASAVAIVFSLGLNTPAYRWLSEHVHFLGGLRSLSRFAILASCTLAMLSAFGAQALSERWGSRSGIGLTAILLLLVTIDGSTRPLDLSPGSVVSDSSVYKVIRGAGPGVVLEIPTPRMSALPGWDAYYSVWSMFHWHPLVNGYSGYYPPDYVQTMVRMELFPEDASVNRLKAHNVRYIVLHREFLEPEQYTSLMLRMAARPEFKSWGNYRDPLGAATLWVMEPTQ